MIAKGKIDIVNVVAGGAECIEVYKGTELVWQSVSSCFGDGGWHNDMPWSNHEGWNNGNN